MKKRLRKWLIGLVLVPLLLLLGLYGALRSPVVQTWLVQQVASKLSAKIGKRVAVEGVDVTFFTGVVLEGLFIEDQEADTLAYIGRLELHIGDINRHEKLIHLTDTRLENGIIRLRRYEGQEQLNFQFILDSLARPKDTTRQEGWRLACPDYHLKDVDLVYRDLNKYRPDSIGGFNPADVHLHHLNLGMEDVNSVEDTLSARIRYASFSDKSGFRLDYLFSELILAPNRFVLGRTEVRTPGSFIRCDAEVDFKDLKELQELAPSLKLKADLQPSKIEAADVAYFVPDLWGIHQKIELAGNVSGRISNIKGRDLSVKLATGTSFEGDVSLKGLPDMKATFMHISVSRFVSDAKDLATLPIPPFSSGKRLTLPAYFSRLGRFTFSGDFTGFVNDFVAYGKLSTAIGSVSTDVALKNQEGVEYNGKVKMNRFNVGRFFDVAELGEVSMNVNVNGRGFDKDHLKTNMKGEVSSLEYKQYQYKQLALEGYLENRLFEGRFQVKDDFIDMDFDGRIDYRGSQPIFDFASNIRKASFHQLHLVPDAYAMELRAVANINMVGDHIDKLEGVVKLNDTHLTKDSVSLDLGDLVLKTGINDGKRNIVLQSDLADLDVTGSFSIADMKTSLMQTIGKYLPSMDGESAGRKTGVQDVRFEGELKNLQDLAYLYFPQFAPGKGTRFRGAYNSAQPYLAFHMDAKDVDVSGRKIDGMMIDMESQDSGIYAQINCDTIHILRKLGARQLHWEGLANADTLDYQLTWDNLDSGSYKGNVSGTLDFTAYPKLAHVFHNTEVTFYDTLWTVAPGNYLVVDTGVIEVSHMEVNSNSQSLKVNGRISRNPYDKLLVGFDDFDLRKTDPFLEGKLINIKGVINGQAALSNLYKNPVISSNIEFRGLRINDQEVGDGVVNSDWDPEGEKAILKGRFARNNIPSVEFAGNYFPFEKENVLDLDINISHIRLNLFKDYVNGFVSDLNGVARGQLHIGGNFVDPKVNGDLELLHTVFNVNYLNTRYNFGSTLRFTDHWIEFDSLVLYDSFHGSRAITYGRFFHDGFRNWGLDLSMDLQNFYCLNTTARNNSLYYGQAYATGLVSVRGSVNDLTIDIAAKPEKGTQINIPLDNPDEVSESGFVMFIDPKKDTLVEKKDYHVDLSGIQLNMDLEVTPDAEVQLIFDEKVGDVMKGRGNSNLKLEISSRGKFNMYGTYEVTDGDYLFTLQNVINKKYKVEQGGTIIWNGNPYDAELDLKAVYNVRTSLSDLFQDTSQVYRKRVPVNCDMFLTGKLLSPEIRFGVSLPNSPEDVRSQVSSVLNSDEEVNRQVFSLLMLSRFTNPGQYGSGVLGSQNMFEQGAGNTTSELLSHQLSNWISQLSDKYDIGVNYRPGDKLTDEELEVALSTQLFHDRVQVESNVGYAGNQHSNTSRVVGDFNVEYKVREDGKFRVKAFNRSNDFDLLSNEAPYTQGVGLFYRQEFDQWKGLMRKIFSKGSKDQEENDQDAAPAPEKENETPDQQ
ncbi:MAG: translocation/assembly module TamB [Flavobacteriales bacterium]|nr:translocation/assembly module TamB [Flavobacteriales bacterium]MCB9449032.1 translocation/assembly module TamB [Flavobacteriales bacterium]